MSETRICGLSEYGECSATFVPIVYWQLCCNKEHSRRRRWLKRKHRIRIALAMVEGVRDTDQARLNESLDVTERIVERAKL